jgi:hypothetical protein
MRTISDSGSAQGQWVIDEFVECYVAWREECEAVRIAYRRWLGAEPLDHPLAYASYVAALDREERAADSFAAQVELARRSADEPH